MGRPERVGIEPREARGPLMPRLRWYLVAFVLGFLAGERAGGPR